MNIHQVNVSYVSEQDRILLKINSSAGEELRLWFTRRLTLGLLPLLGKSAGEQLKRQTGSVNPNQTLEGRRNDLIEKFTRQAAVLNADFATPYRENAEALPLGAEPLLVTEVQVTSLSSGHLQLKFSEKTARQTRDVQVNMDAQLTQGLLHLLHQAMSRSQWLDTPPQALAPALASKQDRVDMIGAEMSGESAADEEQADNANNDPKTGKVRYLN